jgi:hypothetical protein
VTASRTPLPLDLISDVEWTWLRKLASVERSTLDLESQP